MDSNKLTAIFLGSFHQDPNVRISAELELRKLELVPGLIPTLLQLVAPSATPAPVRLAGAIYLKNRIMSSWRIQSASQRELLNTTSPDAGAEALLATTRKIVYTPIPLADRQSLKTNILPLISALSTAEQAEQAAAETPGPPLGASAGNGIVKSQMALILGKMIEVDFPHEWPTLVEEISVCLVNGDQGLLEAGLRGALQVLRGFKYSRSDSGEMTLANVAAHLFPQLLHLAQTVVAQSPTSAADLHRQGVLLHLIIKTYKYSLGTALTPAQQASASIIPWVTLFLTVIQRPVSATLLAAGPGVVSMDAHPWTQAKKWSLYSINRLFTRYGSPTQLPSNMVPIYGAFAESFMTMFMAEIMRTYLGAAEQVIKGEWMGGKCKHHLLAFFEECIKPKTTWLLLKPHVQPLIEQFAFPLMCLMPEEIEAFADDPVEFSRSHFGDFIEDLYTNPASTALSFMSALVEGRKATLMPILNFIQGVVAKYPHETTPREKDGALRMLGTLARVATKTKKVAPMMESFFQAYVLPEFKSPHGFLRCRACEVVEKFESCDMDWENRENIETMFRAILGAVTDPELPVRIQAAIALPELVRYNEVRAGMVPNIGRIMQELLKMSNEVDLDALTNTTRSLVAEFAEEVVPFAVELSGQLMATYVRLIHETLEARERERGNPSQYEDVGAEEKTLVCMNILKTVDQLIGSLEKAPESLARIEEIIVPGLALTIRHNFVDLFDEAYEILDSLLFCQKVVSERMWPVFEAIYTSFKTKAPDFFTEMFNVIDNFISYGAATFAANENYRRMLVDIFDSVMTSPQLGAEDRVVGCKLGEAMLLGMRGNIDEALPSLVSKSMTVLVRTRTDDDFVVTRPLLLHALSLMVTALYYNSAMTLALLSSQPTWTTRFFQIWFKNLDTLERVYDRKLSIAAICAIFTDLATRGDGMDAELVSSANRLLTGALAVFRDLPAAIERKQTLAVEYAEGADADSEDEDEELTITEEFNDEDEDEGEVYNQENDYLEMLAKELNRGDDPDTDDEESSLWSEEVIWASPLDDFDVYQVFTTTLKTIEGGSPQLFRIATESLTAEERAQLHAIGERALAGGEKATGVVLDPAQ